MRAFSDPASPDHAIFFAARLPRVLMGVIVGAMLAAVGTALQALVRNPLAEGGILGISGGGALGAILALVMSAKLGGGEALVPLCAFGAALLSTVAVYRLAMVDGQLEPFTLLLVGVIFNAFWGAAIMLVNSVVNFYYAHSILFWLMGSLEAPTYREAAMVAVLGTRGLRGADVSRARSEPAQPRRRIGGRAWRRRGPASAHDFRRDLGHDRRGGFGQRNHFVRRTDRAAYFAIDVRRGSSAAAAGVADRRRRIHGRCRPGRARRDRAG